MNRKLTSRLIGLSGIVVSALCIWLLNKSINFDQTWLVIQEVNPLFVPALMGIYLLTFPLRSLRWRYMMHTFSIPHDGVFIQSLFIGFAGNNVLPARGGELLRMETFSRRTGVSRTASLSSILLEKVMDVFVLMILLIAAFIGMRQASPLVEKTIYLMVPLVLGTMAVLTVIGLRGDRIAGYFVHKPGRIQQTAGKMLGQVHASLAFIHSGRHLLTIAVLSALIWSLEVGLYVVGLRAIGIEQALLLVAITGLVLVNFSILVPSSPGYIGVFHAALVLALSLFGIPQEAALAAAVLIHASQVLPVTAIGLTVGARYIFGKKSS